jgi:hypothetical protein
MMAFRPHLRMSSVLRQCRLSSTASTSSSDVSARLQELSPVIEVATKNINQSPWKVNMLSKLVSGAQRVVYICVSAAYQWRNFCSEMIHE